MSWDYQLPEPPLTPVPLELQAFDEFLEESDLRKSTERVHKPVETPYYGRPEIVKPKPKPKKERTRYDETEEYYERFFSGRDKADLELDAPHLEFLERKRHLRDYTEEEHTSGEGLTNRRIDTEGEPSEGIEGKRRGQRPVKKGRMDLREEVDRLLRLQPRDYGYKEYRYDPFDQNLDYQQSTIQSVEDEPRRDHFTVEDKFPQIQGRTATLKALTSPEEHPVLRDFLDPDVEVVKKQAPPPNYSANNNYYMLLSEDWEEPKQPTDAQLSKTSPETVAELKKRALQVHYYRESPAAQLNDTEEQETEDIKEAKQEPKTSKSSKHELSLFDLKYLKQPTNTTEFDDEGIPLPKKHATMTSQAYPENPDSLDLLHKIYETKRETRQEREERNRNGPIFYKRMMLDDMMKAVEISKRADDIVKQQRIKKMIGTGARKIPKKNGSNMANKDKKVTFID